MQMFESDLKENFFELVSDLIRKGFIFTRKIESHKKQIMQIHIPKDNIEIIKSLFNTYSTRKILDLKLLLGGISNTYGAVTKTQTRKIITTVKLDLLKYFDEFSYIISYYDNVNYSMMITNVIEEDFLSIENLDINYIQELLKKEGEYKIYTYNDYIAIEDGTFERKTSAYKKLEKYIHIHFGTSNILDIEYLIDDYHFEQQTNEYVARVNLNNNISKKFSVEGQNQDLIYNQIA